MRKKRKYTKREGVHYGRPTGPAKPAEAISGDSIVCDDAEQVALCRGEGQERPTKRHYTKRPGVHYGRPRPTEKQAA